jgi:hypothetical protein
MFHLLFGRTGRRFTVTQYDTHAAAAGPSLTSGELLHSLWWISGNNALPWQTNRRVSGWFRRNA